jgi:hypothetical protein
MASPDNTPKTVMQRIFEAQKAELNRMNSELQANVFG